MTAFIITCAAMIAAALLWILVPLFRAGAESGSRRERRLSGAAIAILVPALAVGMYLSLSDWNWGEAQAVAERTEQMEALLTQLEAKLASNPQDVQGWLLLGRSATEMRQYARATKAYQRAYDLSHGEDVEATIGLGEALVMTDETNLTGRARELFEAALVQAPNHPKALWYGAIAALQSGDLHLGRDRLKLLLAQNPPEQLAALLQRQIQDLDEQLAAASSPASAAPGAQASNTQASNTQSEAPAGPQRVLRVSVAVAPAIEKQLDGPLSLFVLARDPAAGGPPLAVQRRASSDLPLTIELSERDAMIPTRSIASVSKVQVVARLSRSGTPQAQSGDFYGEADYEFADQPGTLSIVIDRVVP